MDLSCFVILPTSNWERADYLGKDILVINNPPCIYKPPSDIGIKKECILNSRGRFESLRCCCMNLQSEEDRNQPQPQVLIPFCVIFVAVVHGSNKIIFLTANNLIWNR